eukprot:3772648-Pleurochrysis_carterae.AAC.3
MIGVGIGRWCSQLKRNSSLSFEAICWLDAGTCDLSLCASPQLSMLNGALEIPELSCADEPACPA